MKNTIKKTYTGLMKFLLQAGMIRSPQISLADVKVHSLSMEDVDLTLNLIILNPNFFRIRIATFDYEIYLGDTRFAEGSIHDPKTGILIRHQSASKIEIPIQLDFAKIGAGVRATFFFNKIGYRIEARLNLKLGLGSIPIQMQKSGELPITLPEIHPGSSPPLFNPEVRTGPSIH
jgi:LEA14-like dessication related protein